MADQLHTNLLHDIEPLQNTRDLDIEWDNDSLSILQKLFCFKAPSSTSDIILPHLPSYDQDKVCNITLSPLLNISNCNKNNVLQMKSNSLQFGSNGNRIHDVIHAKCVPIDNFKYFIEPKEKNPPAQNASQMYQSLNSEKIVTDSKRLCGALNCNRVTQSGRYCTRHGGRRTCKIEGCARVDRGKGLCGAHGGGKKCEFSGCTRAARKERLCCIHLRDKYNQNSFVKSE